MKKYFKNNAMEKIKTRHSFAIWGLMILWVVCVMLMGYKTGKMFEMTYFALMAIIIAWLLEANQRTGL